MARYDWRHAPSNEVLAAVAASVPGGVRVGELVTLAMACPSKHFAAEGAGKGRSAVERGSCARRGHGRARHRGPVVGRMRGAVDAVVHMMAIRAWS